MGTDRSQVYEGPCPCGLGQIIIDSCTPDHPWPTKSHWYDPKINCKACASKYAFEEQDKQLGLVARVEIEARKNRMADYDQYKADFLASPETEDVLNEFINLLNSKPSIAAVHRLLVSEKLIYETYSTFNKHWRGAEKWVNEHIALRPENVLKLSQIVGAKNECISKRVMKLKHLWAEYKRPLPFLGKALIDRMPYR